MAAAVILGCAFGNLRWPRNGSLPLGPGSLREDPDRYQAVRQGHCG